MEQELQFIQNQLWVVIALFLILIAMNIVCYFVRKSEIRDEPDFGEMWNKGDIDSLVNKTNEYLISFPNHSGALYYGAKALIAKKQNIPEAKRRLQTLIDNDPTLKESIKQLLDDINNIEGS